MKISNVLKSVGLIAGIALITGCGTMFVNNCVPVGSATVETCVEIIEAPEEAETISIS